VIASTSLLHGKSRSCGCLRRQRTREVFTKHGATKDRRDTREYICWQHAKRRCHDPRNKSFADYGARGITMCDEWRNDFQAFLRDMGPCPPGHSIDRINNDGPYAPDNCRWATRAQQRRNTRDNIYVTVNGERMVLADAAERNGINRFTAYVRVNRGLTPEQAATLPVQRK
jgi:hypothetical protein